MPILGRVCCLTCKSYADAFFLVRSWVKKSRSALDFHDAPIERASLCPLQAPSLGQCGRFSQIWIHRHGGASGYGEIRSVGSAKNDETDQNSLAKVRPGSQQTSRTASVYPYLRKSATFEDNRPSGASLGIASRKSADQRRNPAPRMPATHDPSDRFYMYAGLPGATFARSGKKCQPHIVCLFSARQLSHPKGPVPLDDASSCLQTVNVPHTSCIDSI